MEDIKVIELPERSSIDTTNYIIVEDEDGTKKAQVKQFRSLLISSLYFNSIEDLKTNTSISLKENDICETLGYHTPGDGGAAKYKITYNPSAVEDGKLVHYLSYSDTLRAEIILDDVINVHQFGAVGDGKTDDTDAIHGAIEASDSRVVEFTNNKRYVCRNTVRITKSNTVINGNGAILVPYYGNGIAIDSVEDITINKLHVDCSMATNAIDVVNSSKVDIKECKIFNVSSLAVQIRNSKFVNITYGKMIGTNNGTMITLASDRDKYNRFVNIIDCEFVDFKKAISVLTSDETSEVNTTLNLDKCNYSSTVNNSCCIDVSGYVEMISIYANTVSACDTFLYFGGAGKGDISCRGISCMNTAKVFNIETSQGVLHLDGSIKVSNDTILFENMNGKLRSSISWDLLADGASFTNRPTGEIYDSIHPYNYGDKKGYSISNDKLTLREVRNLHVDWSSSTNNIVQIENGVKGQLIYLKSSTNKSILAVASKIILSDTSIKLGRYKGILMRYDGSMWVQIQYEDSTVVQTVSEELKIDYSQIAFDTTQIITE